MSDATDPGPAARSSPPPKTPGAPRGGAEWIGATATLASLAWLALAGWYLATLTPNGLAILAVDPLATAVALLGIVVPVALIWIVATLARLSRSLRQEAAHLRDEIDAMREAHAVQARMGAAALRRDVEARLADVGKTAAPAPGPAPTGEAPRRAPVLTAPARPGRSPLEVLRAARPVPAPAPSEAPRADPAPDAEADVPPARTGLDAADVLRAFDLPRGRDDAEGFALVRRALADPAAGPVLSAAQTALALLSEGNLSATALPPAPPAAWRAWLSGEGAPSSLGEMRDPAATALATGRARAEPPFAAAAAALLSALEEAGPALAAAFSDEDLEALDRTRTGRAARIMARATGALD
ncbi:hypothetical protein JQC91_13130 [Jannaschia sp. Os4]|uniref:hypothetical protein n=1 Tax=Jannaschia sp. Os4 TaxID=2807617 RepID=UPI001939F401|nr:hypothetical protein [Jannaschia sp. Os4]MBM2577245.1 hypothetical protein [Jannaschia sp. Os4]